MDAPPPPATVEIIDGLSAIADRYALFVIDQWGVLHDGHTPHPGAIDALERLKAAGGSLAILSNSGKRVAESHRRMRRMGFDPDLYDAVVTSGEEVHCGLRDRDDPFYRDIGSRFLMFAWDADRGIVEGLDYEEVEDVAAADFILCAGTDERTLAEYDPVLKQALARNLPLTCANPDKVSVQPDGSLKMCPGAIAERYESMGGRVRWHGKPWPAVYDRIRALTGRDGPAIGIGDSLEHDIAGARHAGMDQLFITGGIHRAELSEPLESNEIAALGGKFNAVPTFASIGFRW